MIEYEERHKLKKHDFDILKKCDFKYAPVGFKFFNDASDVERLGLGKLDKRIAWCQMLRKEEFYKIAHARLGLEQII